MNKEIYKLQSSNFLENYGNTNNKSVVLVIAPPWGVDYPPLSLAYLSTYLKAKGIKTKVIDSNINIFYSSNASLRKLWDMNNFLEWNSEDKFGILKEKIGNKINEEVKSISRNNPNIVCFSVNLANMLTTKEFIKKLKKFNELKIVCGGPAIKDKWVREHFYNLSDYFIVGEGEDALFNLCKNLDRNENKVISGVIKFENGIESDFIERKRIDINSIPFPDYDVFPLKKYKIEHMPFLLSRGCIRQCLFCNDTKIFKNFLSRDPKKVIKEIIYYHKKYGAKSFKSHDLLINGDLEKLEEFCDLLIKSKIKINWSGQAIIREMPLKLFIKMKKSGLNSIVFGLESASDRLVKSMNKNHTEKIAENVINRAKKAGIKVYLNLMVGFPGEKESDLIKTMEFMKRNKENISGVSSLNKCVIFKDTALYRRREDFNIKVQEDNGHWIQWTDKEGNDCEGRKNKVFRMLKFLNNIDMPVEETNEFSVKIKKNIKDKIKFKIINIKKDIIYKNIQRVISLSDLLHSNFIKKISNQKDKIKVFKKKAIPYPKYATIDITNSCNLNCIGCWTHSPLLKDKEASEEWKSQIIDFETLKKLIDCLKGLGTERIRLTGGGEPFMHPRIMDVIRIIKEKGMACDITTNFTLLNKDKIKKLFDLNVDEIVASIWAGDAETYVKTHPNQTKETFEKIKENLIFIAQYKEKFRKGPKVIMANVISNVNYNKIDEIAKFTTHVSLDEIYFTLIDPIKGRTGCLLLNEKQRRVLIRQLKQAKKVIRDYNKRSKIHKINIDDINRFIKKIKSKKADEGKYDIEVLKKPCYIGYIFARIMANGDVVPCCRAVMYPMGNINKTLFKDIWFSDRYDKFRERALHDNKLNPYFKKIGCFMTCDNVVHNREIENMKQ